MTNPTLWNQLFVWPIVNLLVALYKFFEWLHIPGPLGFAVIALTIVIRLILYPLMAAQMKSAKKMQQLKPHLDALNAKHKDDKKALQQAQLDLYKSHGVNPAAGCLPLLIQLPVLIALYNVFYQVLQNGNMAKLVEDLNKVLYTSSLHLSGLDLSFFGSNLGVKPSEWQTHGVWLLLIPVVTAALQWWQSKLMLPQSTVATGKQLEVKGKEEKKPEDTAMEMQKQMAMITPIMFGMFAYQFPLGLALYWNVFGVFGIMQQLAVNREK
ncbi:membrane protein insertase YidC [Patescibacteria group bacterium]|nr:membrane protein insertase YidC [Patescibacteria group bacterium]